MLFKRQPAQSHSLLAQANGEELLWLMLTSNAAMRRQIHRELDFRAANIRLPGIRPARAMALGRAA